VDTARIATAGNSFGGIITVLAVKQVDYCAAVDGAGGAEAWSAPVAAGMTNAVRQSQVPIFFFQAENDYSLEHTQQLGEEMRRLRRAYEAKIYPAFGSSSSDGHSFAWRGSAVWADDVFRFLNANCR
jgi:dienelactone hydrolase